MTARSRRSTPMEATISAHGLKLFVREQGEGHPLVLINGIGGNSEMWGSAERILAASSRTIVFDSPGTGRSETPLLPRSIPGACARHWRPARRAWSRASRPPWLLIWRRGRATAREGCTGPHPAARARLDVLRMGRNRGRPRRARAPGGQRADCPESARLHVSALGARGMVEPSLAFAGTRTDARRCWHRR